MEKEKAEILFDEEGNPYYLSDEEPETPEKSATVSDNSESKDNNVQPIPDKYAGKTAEELIEILKNQEKMIGKQGNELGNLKKKVESNPFFKTDDELDIEAIDNQIKRYQDRLESLDEYDDDQYEKLTSKISELEKHKIAVKAELNVYQKISEKDNASVFSEFMSEVRAMTDEIGDEEFETLKEEAKKHADKYGRITKNNCFAAAVNLYGTAFLSLVEKQTEMKMRKEMSTNKNLVTPGVNTSKTQQRIMFNTKDPDALADQIYRKYGIKGLEEMMAKRGVPIQKKR